jgi:hypothetical protein
MPKATLGILARLQTAQEGITPSRKVNRISDVWRAFVRAAADVKRISNDRNDAIKIADTKVWQPIPLKSLLEVAVR